jgi:hypothetical protein
MASLYEAGWRQGSIFEMALSLDAIILGVSGRPERSSVPHGVWVIATQDCDLDRAEADDPDPSMSCGHFSSVTAQLTGASVPPGCDLLTRSTLKRTRHA